MTEYARSACPLNCPDSCDFLVRRLPDRLALQGDPALLGYDSFICTKGHNYAAQTHDPRRLLYPYARTRRRGWRRITWADAYERLEEQVRAALAAGGSQSILHYYGTGYGGVLGALDQRFFQALGGATVPRGSLCWANGIRAQVRDFGEPRAGTPEDFRHAGLIILWGRDPAVTHKHLVPILLQARKNGARIIAINPLRVRSAAFADEFIRVNPGTDGALALGVAHCLLAERRMDFAWAQKHLAGFGPYAALVKDFPPEKAERITGVPAARQRTLAVELSAERPALIYIGYGMQRYGNGTNTVRAIDALAAVTGNIGRRGGGIFYAHNYHSALAPLLLPEETYRERTAPYALMAEELRRAEPPIRLAVVTRANPLAAQPDSAAWSEFWRAIPYRVTLDTYFSATAAASDLVLPVANVFEKEDLIVNSQNPWLRYAQPVLPPQGEARPEAVIFTDLAERLGVGDKFSHTAADWLKYVLAPLQDAGITPESLQTGPARAPYIPDTAWAEGDFATEDGRARLLSREEFTAGEGFSPVARFYAAEERLPPGVFILLTPHADLCLNSQFTEGSRRVLYLHPAAAAAAGLSHGDRARVRTERGELEAETALSEDIHPHVAVIPFPGWEKGRGVNELTAARMDPAGESAALYDLFCRVEPAAPNGGI
ncbi:MAG: molybdopterin-dependent oxidoreductase [Gracilibacteraceae bacterium]|jgi:anaerobic selenocysteine-containing dehydrogenase|nr:molybdopterin-dependent oxidoreductase [Gracilibacteraceae bacterium]